VQPWASSLHTRASVTKQYNLVLANGRWCLEAGKVIVGLTSTGHVSQTLVVLHPRAQVLGEGDEHPPTLSCGVWSIFTFKGQHHFGKVNMYLWTAVLTMFMAIVTYGLLRDCD